MMKIRIITIHCIPNFGSVYQAYALSESLKQMGYEDVEIIDYRPSYFKPHTTRSIIAVLLNLRKYISRSRKFRMFINKNLRLTDNKYRTLKQLKAADINPDLLIAGGDQLWNPYHDCGRDDAYKLVFSHAKKISYATSLGQTFLSRMELTNLASKVASFSAISVRESSSVELLSEYGIHAEMCVDPVYLLSSDKYMKYIRNVHVKKYLLVYLVTPSPLLDRAIDLLKTKYNLKVVLCSGFSKKCYCDLFFKDPGPEEVLSLIYHADIVLSASFHATSFSLIFKKQFFTILPDSKTNERIVDLLKTRGLLHRILTDSVNIDSSVADVINYDKIISYEPYIESSYEFLRKALAE